MNSQTLTFNPVGDIVPPPGSVLRSPGSWRLGKLADNLPPYDVFLLILLTQLINTSIFLRVILFLSRSAGSLITLFLMIFLSGHFWPVWISLQYCKTHYVFLIECGTVPLRVECSGLSLGRLAHNPYSYDYF